MEMNDLYSELNRYAKPNHHNIIYFPLHKTSKRNYTLKFLLIFFHYSQDEPNSKISNILNIKPHQTE